MLLRVSPGRSATLTARQLALPPANSSLWGTTPPIVSLPFPTFSCLPPPRLVTQQTVQRLLPFCCCDSHYNKSCNCCHGLLAATTHIAHGIYHDVHPHALCYMQLCPLNTVLCLSLGAALLACCLCCSQLCDTHVQGLTYGNRDWVTLRCRLNPGALLCSVLASCCWQYTWTKCCQTARVCVCYPPGIPCCLPIGSLERYSRLYL